MGPKMLCAERNGKQKKHLTRIGMKNQAFDFVIWEYIFQFSVLLISKSDIGRPLKQDVIRKNNECFVLVEWMMVR